MPENLCKKIIIIITLGDKLLSAVEGMLTVLKVK